MVLSQLFGKDRVIGVDIGSALIKVLELEPDGDKWRVARAVLHPTPPDTVHDGIVTDVQAVSSAVRDTIRGADIHASGAVAAVSGSQVLVRLVELPRMSESVLRKTIRFEAAKYISANVDDSLVEFEVLDRDPGNGQMQVMLVAAARELVASRVAVLENAGLEPLVVDIEAFALMRSLVEHSTDSNLLSQTVALLDMGASHTDLNIVSGGRFVLTRNIPIAGSSLTMAIKSLAGCDEISAEALKKRIRIGPVAQEDAEPMDENLVRAIRAIQPLLDELLREIRRSLHYYQSQFPEGTPEATVSRLLLTGGTSRMPGLPEYVSARLNVQADVMNVLTDSGIKEGCLTEEEAKADGPLLAVAAGLALRSLAPVQKAEPPKKAQPPKKAESTKKKGLVRKAGPLKKAA